MIKIYGIKNCDSVKKALKFFKENNLEYLFYDFKSETLPCSKVSDWLKLVEIKTIFNSRSTTYRNLKLKEKNLNDIEKEEWLCKENLLIKRPIIEFNNNITIGFNENNYKGIFL